jgi:Ca2+-binding EF-hand superfamily protein
MNDIRTIRIVFGVFWLLTGVLAVTAGAAPSSAGKEPDDVQAMVYLGERGPVLLRLHVRIDGKPYPVGWSDFVRKLFEYADVDSSGSLAAAEVVRVPTVQLLRTQLRGVIGGVGDRGNSPSLAGLDTSKDGKVTLEELQAYYRKSGFGPVQMRAAQVQGRSGAMTQTLFKLLDANGDGKLTSDEIARASEALHRIDSDEDENISTSEVVPDVNPYGQVIFADPAGMAATQPTGPFVFVLPGEPAERVTRPILERYDRDKNGKLGRAELGWAEPGFRRVDTSGDGAVTGQELARWLEGPSDLELAAALGQQPARKPPGGLLRALVDAGGRSNPTGNVEIHAPPRGEWPLAGMVQRHSSGVVLKQGITQIEIRGGELVRFRMDGTRQFYVQQFKAALKDKKDHLTKAEVEAVQFLRWLLVFADRNGDGKLYEREINAFFDVLGPGSGCFATLVTADHGAGLFELLDANRDGRLSLRELRGGWERLAPWDQAGKGAVTREEIPREYQLTINQGPGADGVPGGAVVIRGGMPAPPPGSGRGPLWFRKMDKNGDGDVSPREWLGTTEDFRKIDTDADRLISAEEAERAGASQGGKK